FAGGVFVSAGDFNRDGKADVLAGSGAGGGVQPFDDGARARGFDLATGAVLLDFQPYPTFFGGVRVSARDVNGDGTADVVTGAGPGGGPHVLEFDGRDLRPLGSFFAFDPAFTGGVFVA